MYVIVLDCGYCSLCKFKPVMWFWEWKRTQYDYHGFIFETTGCKNNYSYSVSICNDTDLVAYLCFVEVII